jgi:hypothetical protein
MPYCSFEKTLVMSRVSVLCLHLYCYSSGLVFKPQHYSFSKRCKCNPVLQEKPRVDSALHIACRIGGSARCNGEDAQRIGE